MWLNLTLLPLLFVVASLWHWKKGWHAWSKPWPYIYMRISAIQKSFICHFLTYLFLCFMIWLNKMNVKGFERCYIWLVLHRNEPKLVFGWQGQRMFINNTQRRIKDTQCEYTNTRTSNAKIYMNPTLGKEVGEINPPLKLGTKKNWGKKQNHDHKGTCMWKSTPWSSKEGVRNQKHSLWSGLN